MNFDGGKELFIGAYDLAGADKTAAWLLNITLLFSYSLLWLSKTTKVSVTQAI